VDSFDAAVLAELREYQHVLPGRSYLSTELALHLGADIKLVRAALRRLEHTGHARGRDTSSGWRWKAVPRD
jgi:DNA-binding GntR family transcriptional regulator